MHGDISLESKLGFGTKAQFYVPFKRAEIGSSPLIDLGNIPDRLQSDLSITGSYSSDGRATPPLSSATHLQHRGLGRQQSVKQPGVPRGINDIPSTLTESERKNIKVLVVEDKYDPVSNV